MTDHKEEQSNEIEALESIYPDELEVLLTEPLHVFSIIITPTELEDTDQTANITVKFRYVENYPDEGPVFEITEYDNLDDEHIDTLNDVIKEQIEENIGMAMVFTIVSALQEKIAVIIEDRHQKELEEKQRAEREIEAAAQKKFEGTKVTVESFLAWKTMFEAEINEFKAKKLKENPEPKGLTGKELFLQDSKMDESDVIFLQSEDAGVEVDESLFQDIDDLDIEDDDLDIDDEAVD